MPRSFALSFVKLDGDFSHLLIYHNDEGWETENVEGRYATLYELLQHMQHFVNLVDSPQLVPDEHQSNAQRKFTTFLIEKHEFLGILFYRHSFSGLRLFRRVLLHTLVFLLLVGTNLVAYSVIDADCVKKRYCSTQCVDGCVKDPALTFNVTNESGTRVTIFEKELFFYPEPSGSSEKRAAFAYCADIRNPLWALSVVCVPLCTPQVDRFFTRDIFQWPREQCRNGSSTPVNRSLLVCEQPSSAPRIGTAPPALATCDGLLDSSFSAITLLKSAVIAIFLIVCDQVISISLKLSQPIEWRTDERRILLRKPTAAAIAYVICGVFLLIAGTFIGLGVWFMGTLGALWSTFAVGFTISVLLKYLVFSPLRIWFWWLLLRFGIWRFLEGKSGDRASNRTLKRVTISKTMRRIEKIMLAGVEDKKYAEKAEKRRSQMVQKAELHEVKAHDKPEEASVRLQSSSSKRKLGAAKEEIAVETIEASPASPRDGARGARQLGPHHAHEEPKEAEAEEKVKEATVARKPRPTEPVAVRPIYMDTNMIDDQKDMTISFKPASAAELIEMAESAAEMYNRESNTVFTGPVCCTFLVLLVLLYIGTAVAALLFDCNKESVLAANSGVIVAAVTFAFAAVSLSCFIYVCVKRDTLGRCTLPCVTLFFVVGVLALGLMLGLTLVVNLTTCPPKL